MPAFDISDAQAGHRDGRDRVPGDEAGASRVVAACRVGPDGGIHFLPRSQYVSDSSTGCVGSRTGLERRGDSLGIALTAPHGPADLGRSTISASAREGADLPYARASVADRGPAGAAS